MRDLDTSELNAVSGGAKPRFAKIAIDPRMMNKVVLKKVPGQTFTHNVILHVSPM